MGRSLLQVRRLVFGFVNQKLSPSTVVAGAMSYELGLELVVKRAKLFSSNATAPGGMAIIAASKEVINQLIHHLGLNGRVVIAVYNGPESHVISGELSSVDVLLSNAKMQGIKGAKLNVTQGKSVGYMSSTSLISSLQGSIAH